MACAAPPLLVSDEARALTRADGDPLGNEAWLETELLYFSERDHRKVSVPFVMVRSSMPIMASHRKLFPDDSGPAVEFGTDDANQLVKIREDACLDF
eukprot:CAMPEP_0172153054 /NCGR_PEP_ID=MMETSP1050-20130122/1203_1 /TAXON_ID=233186 /ORGANISM="Cryptomonas curvata, Strain CCAP979/52" /LENGTH=96 /DNA_ID=CAMNT_0012821491 /DNA_START=213 /DNA_END=502 /DNA_ORIENTATION=+